MNISRMQEAGYDLARERLLVTFRNVIRGANQSGSKSLSPLVNGKAYLVMGLTPQHSSKSDRFEMDGANAARAFLRQQNISPQEIDDD
jgi:hypothetical protein